MAAVVLVHGIFNYVRGAIPEEAAERRARDCRPKLASGLARIGLTQAPDLVMAYYADLLRDGLPLQAQEADDDPAFEDLTAKQMAEAAEWLATAGAPIPRDPQNIALAPLRQMLGWLVSERGGRLTRAVREGTVRRLERVMVTLLREAEAYTAWPDRREEVRNRVAKAICDEQPAVVVAHSLGSLVTYETLHKFKDLNVELLVTVGSPLRLSSLVRRLDPGLINRRGERPAGVQHWVNIAGVGDIIAIPPPFSEVFPVHQDLTTNTGLAFHGFGTYLANGLTAAAIFPYVS